ncbi:MAG: electron transfer flavoprotein subunit beta/FixA family protein [Tepidanaerobacteraceae bacterium]
MNIVVCVKQVPDTTEITIDKRTKTLNREAAPAVMNPFDLFAIEEALQLTEKFGGSVTVISMGPERAKQVIHEAYSMGVTSGILISDPAFSGSDTYCTAKILSSAISKIGNVHLIICGKQAIDGDTAQVGPEIAEILDIPHVSYAKKILGVSNGKIRLQRVLENGYEVVEMEMPGLITVLKDINIPRLPSLKLLRASKKRNIPVWGLEDLALRRDEVGLDGSPTTVISTFVPEMKSSVRMLQGGAREKVRQLFDEIGRSFLEGVADR